MSAWDQAADLLIFYMRRVWEAAGLGWESDNSAEMRSLVDHLATAVLQQIEDEIRGHCENDPHLYADGSKS